MVKVVVGAAVPLCQRIDKQQHLVHVGHELVQVLPKGAVVGQVNHNCDKGKSSCAHKEEPALALLKPVVKCVALCGDLARCVELGNKGGKANRRSGTS